MCRPTKSPPADAMRARNFSYTEPVMRAERSANRGKRGIEGWYTIAHGRARRGRRLDDATLDSAAARCGVLELRQDASAHRHEQHGLRTCIGEFNAGDVHH